MSQEIELCKTPLLSEEQMLTIMNAITIATIHYKDTQDDFERYNLKLQQLEKIYIHLETTPWKELPTPNTLNK